MALIIRPHLKRLGLTQDALAAKIGRDKGFVSSLINGKRSASLETLTRIATALDITLGELLDNPEHPAGTAVEHVGFRENAASPFQLPPGAPTAQLIQRCTPQIRHLTTYQMQIDAHGFGLLANDVLLVEMNGNAQDGDIVLVGILTDEPQTVITRVKRCFGDWLLSPISTAPAIKRDAADQSIAIRGIIRGTLRGLDLDSLGRPVT
jgi:transcriptional regulator with XRE-family HTH domain